MNEAGIKDAISAALHFMTYAREALKDARTIEGCGKELFVNTGKASGACRRASMDLTRALAEMRKP